MTHTNPSTDPQPHVNEEAPSASVHAFADLVEDSDGFINLETVPGTLKALLEGYFSSPDFTNLSVSTMSTYRSVLRVFLKASLLTPPGRFGREELRRRLVDAHATWGQARVVQAMTAYRTFQGWAQAGNVVHLPGLKTTGTGRPARRAKNPHVQRVPVGTPDHATLQAAHQRIASLEAQVDALTYELRVAELVVQRMTKAVDNAKRLQEYVAANVKVVEDMGSALVEQNLRLKATIETLRRKPKDVAVPPPQEARATPAAPPPSTVATMPPAVEEALRAFLVDLHPDYLRDIKGFTWESLKPGKAPRKRGQREADRADGIAVHYKHGHIMTFGLDSSFAVLVKALRAWFTAAGVPLTGVLLPRVLGEDKVMTPGALRKIQGGAPQAPGPHAAQAAEAVQDGVDPGVLHLL